MFTKDNIISVRYTDPQNTTIEVLYTDDEDGKTRPFFFPASPTTSIAWKILKEAKWTPSKVADSTVSWIKEQSYLQYKVAERFAEQLAADQTTRLQDEYDSQTTRLQEDYDTKVMSIRDKYDARVMDMSSSINNESTVSSLYTLINDLNANEEAVFKLKLDILEDSNNFQELNKTDEKARRRDIRKCKTLKDLLNFL
jgi:vacuolar-type H+-ATPase subunit H